VPSQLIVELALLLLDGLMSVSSAPVSYALQGTAEPTGRSSTFDAHQATSRPTPVVCEPQKVEGAGALTVGLSPDDLVTRTVPTGFSLDEVVVQTSRSAPQSRP